MSIIGAAALAIAGKAAQSAASKASGNSVGKSRYDSARQSRNSSSKKGGSLGSAWTNGVGGTTLTQYGQNATGGSSNSGGSSGGDGYTQRTFTNNTNAANPNDYWTLDHRDGALYHYVNGIGYQVMKNDSLGRYDSGMQAYLKQNGGYANTSTQNNPTGYDIYAKILDNGYQASREAAQRQIDAAVGTLQGSIGKANSQYDNANRAAYVNYMQGQQNMGQMLKSMGLTKTGASESTMLGANTDYANQVNSNESARQQALQDIYNRIAETQANGAVTLADIDRELGNNLANAYASMLSADRSQSNADRDYRLQREQMDYQKQQDARSNLLTDISILQDIGATGSTLLYLLNRMGYNLTEADLAVYSKQRNDALRL